MINQISFKNYKAFESGEMKIKPITILLGANSIGKSSLLQFILMLQQTAVANENYQAALKLHGGFLSLGEGRNIFRKHNIDKPLTIKVNFEDDYLANWLSGNLLYEKVEELFEYVRMTDNIKLRLKDKFPFKESIQSDEIKNFRKFLNHKNHKQDIKSYPNLNAIINSIIDYAIENSKLIRKHYNDKEFLNDYYFYRLNNSFKHIESRKPDIINGLDFIKKLSEFFKDKPEFAFEYEILLIDNTLRIKSFKLTINNNSIFDINLEISKVQKFSFNCQLIADKSINTKVGETIKKIIISPRTIFLLLTQI